MPYDVFISHSAKDKATADAIHIFESLQRGSVPALRDDSYWFSSMSVFSSVLSSGKPPGWLENAPSRRLNPLRRRYFGAAPASPVSSKTASMEA